MKTINNIKLTDDQLRDEPLGQLGAGGELFLRQAALLAQLFDPDADLHEVYHL